MPARHRLTAVSILLLVLSAASIVHSSAVARAQSGRPVAPADAAGSPHALTGKGGEGISPSAADMRVAILEAVHTGRIKDLRQAIELNEMPPVINDSGAGDPIATLREASLDGEGRDVLEAIGRILEADWIAAPLGRDIENSRVYVWPRFAETGVVGLTVDEIADLARIVSAGALAPMLERGVYDGWRIGIAADGTWHFLRR